MTDLEIETLCAQAMGVTFDRAYCPLTNDEQAMALVKRFEVGLAKTYISYWEAYCYGSNGKSFSDNLNRAICECVAKMQSQRIAA